MKMLYIFYLVVVIVSCGAKEGFSGNPEYKEQVTAIQEKIFHRNHEIGFHLDYIPDDDFYDVFTVGLSYTFKFNDYLAWEVARGVFAFNVEKDLKNDLEDEFEVTPTQYTEPEYMIHSHVILRPLYGKDAVWNRGVINHETFLFFGGGLVNYEKHYSYGSSGSENALSISFGVGIKYFLNDYICLNFEIRDIINFKDERTENNILFGAGLGFRFNLAPRVTDTTSELETLDHYLRDEDNE